MTKTELDSMIDELIRLNNVDTCDMDEVDRIREREIENYLLENNIWNALKDAWEKAAEIRRSRFVD